MMEGKLKATKFARWERPDREGGLGNLMPDVEGMERERWMFSEAFRELR